jgi:hypothetical protein
VHQLDGDLTTQDLVVRATELARRAVREFPEENVSILEMGLAADVTEELLHAPSHPRQADQSQSP